MVDFSTESSVARAGRDGLESSSSSRGKGKNIARLSKASPPTQAS